MTPPFNPEIPPLFSHQNEALAAALSELKVADRCKVIMACATGKTRVGTELAIASEARTVVIYLPSLALMRQTLRPWLDSAARFAGGMSYLCVCSDSTVAPRANSDESIVTVAELVAEFKLPKKAVTTNSDDVRDFLTLPCFNGVRIIFSTYQSSNVVRDGCPKEFQFDLGLFDEAHRTASNGSVFSAPLLDSHTRTSKRVFMTATPKHLTFRKRKNRPDAEPELLYSMDNETLYGKSAYTLSIRNAINRGIICDYRVLVSIVTDDLINSSLLGQDDIEKIAHAIAIRKAIDKYGVRKIVTFHKTVIDAKNFAHSTVIQKELGIDTFHVNGGMTMAVREGNMDRFRSASSGLVSNSRCLTEGVDVPAIDMVAFLHPKGSQIDIVQALGRALRKGADKRGQTGYILLPIYVPGDLKGGLSKEKLENAMRDQGYDFIFDVLEALREQDEVVNTAIRTAASSKVNRKPVKLGNFIEIEGSEEHLDILRECIFTMCVDTLAYSWDVWMAHFIKYGVEYGHVNVHHDYVTPEGIRLGQKCMSLRQFYKAGQLELSRILELESIGFQWAPRDDVFENTYSLLKDYKDKYGTCNAPKDTVYKGIKIGHRCGQLRQDYRLGGLSADRIKRLEAIGFEWSLFDAKFIQTINLLKAYQAKNGHINMTAITIYRGERLGARCNRLRQDRKNGKLTQYRIKELDALGFNWSVLNVDTFGDDKTIQYLKKYKQEFQHVDVPVISKYNGIALGKRCSQLRKRYKTSQLPADLIAELEAIGFKWQIKKRSTM